MSEPVRCDYAEPGQRWCPDAICDCFRDLYPDDPFGLHPEAFVVMSACPSCGEVGMIGGAVCAAGCGYERPPDE